MCVRGGSEHWRNSLISLMAISSAAASVSSAVRFSAAYKCIINHGFILGKGSPSSFFHPSFAVVPRGEFSYLWCSAPIQSKDWDALTWFIIKRATLDWFHIAASLRWLHPNNQGKKLYSVVISREMIYCSPLYINTGLMWVGNRKNSYVMAVWLPWSKLQHAEIECHQLFRHPKGASVMSSLILQKANKRKAWLASKGKGINGLLMIRQKVMSWNFCKGEVV